MRDLKWYEGKLPSFEYREILENDLMSYPSKDNHRSYTLIYESGVIEKGQSRDFVCAVIGQGNSVPSSIAPLQEYQTSSGTVIVKFSFDEKSYKEEMSKYQKQCSILMDAFKQDLATAYLHTHFRYLADAVYYQAWERGHSAGLSEVMSYYCDLAIWAEEIAESVLKAEKEGKHAR